jgi:hypothetical protein
MKKLLIIITLIVCLPAFAQQDETPNESSFCRVSWGSALFADWSEINWSFVYDCDGNEVARYIDVECYDLDPCDARNAFLDAIRTGRIQRPRHPRAPFQSGPQRGPADQ